MKHGFIILIAAALMGIIGFALLMAALDYDHMPVDTARAPLFFLGAGFLLFSPVITVVGLSEVFLALDAHHADEER
jgi:predicted cobalt transporter CbtA